MRFNSHLLDVQPPPITEVKSWLTGRAADPRPLIDCCQAVPDYPPAPQLLDFLRQQLDRVETSRYSPDEGLAEVRASLGRWYGRRYDARLTAAEICLTVGASQAFWLAISSLCQAGDEVIVAAPAYFDHPMALQTLGIRPVWVPFAASADGQLDPTAVAQRIGARTRAILLVTPSNPTGIVTAPATLDRLFALARAHGLTLILDETYNAFLPPGAGPHALFTRPDWQETLVHIASFGKTFALTGFRAGALVAGAPLIEQALKVQDSMVVCAPRLSQLAIGFGCDHLDDWVAGNTRMMLARHARFRELFLQAATGFRLLASGGFFAWVSHPWPELGSRAAARRLALEQNLICLPGAAFGPGLDGCLRLAFGNLPAEQIPAAIGRLATAGGRG
ncbi:MAG: aminotransferase [Desulfuromonadales bacterium]|nr:aminotransferase [Desulfuromonadales bacterium]